ncbi:hypothetical protein YB2330_002967 [Saitoella coloradoensis]
MSLTPDTPASMPSHISSDMDPSPTSTTSISISPPTSFPSSSPQTADLASPDDSDSDSDYQPSIIQLWRKPTLLGLLRSTAINLLLPFINGLMLGWGEIFAHEVAFRWGWRNARVFPPHRMSFGPGIGMERRRRITKEGVIEDEDRILREMSNLDL